jgi:Cytochrome bd terminal oxidase subunit I
VVRRHCQRVDEPAPAGYGTAAVYAAAMLRGRTDRYHRLGFVLPFAMAAVLTPVRIGFGDWAARFLADNQPVKLAAPDLLVGELTIAEGAGSRATLVAMLVSLAIGALLFVPALLALLRLHLRDEVTGPEGGPPRSVDGRPRGPDDRRHDGAHPRLRGPG